MTRSALEERFLALVASAGLPTPRTNVRLAPASRSTPCGPSTARRRVDGAASHRTATAFAADRRRDGALQVARYRIVRFTWQDVAERAGDVVATLTALLRQP